MKHAIKDIYKLLLSNYVKVSKVFVENMSFDEQDMLWSMDKIEVINFHQTMDVNGIRLWGYTVKHILGVDVFMDGTAGVYILYTGDFFHEEDCY